MSYSHPAAVLRLSDESQELPAATEEPYTEHECLVLVLQRVPLHDRLARCALVSKAWASAAAAATASIDLIINRECVGQDVHPSMLKCLHKHGQGVTNIKAVQPICDSSYFGAHVELPCATLTNLRSLSLQGMSVHLAQGYASELSTAFKPGKRTTTEMMAAKTGVPAVPSNSSATAVSKGNAFSAKTAAGTTTKPVAAPASDATALARQFGRLGLAAPSLPPLLPRLQSLHLVDSAFAGLKMLPHFTGLTTLRSKAHVELLPAPNSCSNFMKTLRQLTGLSELCFNYSYKYMPALRSNTLDAITRLQQLQRLELTVSGKLDHTFLGRLPASLTALHLQAEGEQRNYQERLNLRSVPMLQGLTGLQELSLKRIVMDPSRLAISGTLTFLQLETVVGNPKTDVPALFEPWDSSRACDTWSS